MPPLSVVHVYFVDGSVEQLPSSTAARLDHGGWITLVDRVQDSEGLWCERSRSYPPSAVRKIVSIRREQD